MCVMCIHTCIIESLYHTQAIDFDHLARMAMIKRRVRLERRNIWRKFLGGTADLGRKIRCTDIWGKMDFGALLDPKEFNKSW